MRYFLITYNDNDNYNDNVRISLIIVIYNPIYILILTECNDPIET